MEKQHGEEVNYCPNEGSMEIAGAIDAVTLEKRYCKNTAEVVAVKMLKKNLYCQKCGYSLSVVKKKRTNCKIAYNGWCS